MIIMDDEGITNADIDDDDDCDIVILTVKAANKKAFTKIKFQLISINNK